MNLAIDETHDPSLRSFVSSANDEATDFPIQNLPFGIFSHASTPPRPGVAIGEKILDLQASQRLGFLGEFVEADVLGAPSLNALFALGGDKLRALRRHLSDLLSEGRGGNSAFRNKTDLLFDMADCRLYRPTAVANYTDFYAGIHHARAAGALLTPENPLPPNYKFVPIAYHGRASSVQLGGGTVRRPVGQRPPAQGGRDPSFGPCERLDFELEMGFYIGSGNALGTPIEIADADRHIVGFSLLNDWSARDVQRWEMFPLGPFLSKSFATFVSPWVVTTDALAPFRTGAMERPNDDPRPLPYLFDDRDQAHGGIDVALTVLLSTENMRSARRDPVTILTSNARYLYWTPAQMVAHHTVNGCNLQPGDLIGTGTISGPTDAELSSMLEFTYGGTRPVTLSNGERRGFLLDGDEITFKGRCAQTGFVSIGFGDCSGRIAASREVG